jgi:hypothetical protein
MLSCVEWFQLAQDRGQWQAFVKMVLGLWITSKLRNFVTSSIIIKQEI